MANLGIDAVRTPAVRQLSLWQRAGDVTRRAVRQPPADVTPPERKTSEGGYDSGSAGRGSPRALMADAFGLVLQEALARADMTPAAPTAR